MTALAAASMHSLLVAAVVELLGKTMRRMHCSTPQGCWNIAYRHIALQHGMYTLRVPSCALAMCRLDTWLIMTT